MKSCLGRLVPRRDRLRARRGGGRRPTGGLQGWAGVRPPPSRPRRQPSHDPPSRHFSKRIRPGLGRAPSLKRDAAHLRARDEDELEVVLCLLWASSCMRSAPGARYTLTVTQGALTFSAVTSRRARGDRGRAYGRPRHPQWSRRRARVGSSLPPRARAAKRSLRRPARREASASMPPRRPGWGASPDRSGRADGHASRSTRARYTRTIGLMPRTDLYGR